MKLTESYLRNLIKEELKQFLDISEQQNSNIYFGLPTPIINQAYKAYTDPRNGLWEPTDAPPEVGFRQYLSNNLEGANKRIFDNLTTFQQFELYEQASKNNSDVKALKYSDAARSKRGMRDLVRRRNIPSVRELPVR